MIISSSSMFTFSDPIFTSITRVYFQVLPSQDRITHTNRSWTFKASICFKAYYPAYIRQPSLMAPNYNTTSRRLGRQFFLKRTCALNKKFT